MLNTSLDVSYCPGTVRKKPVYAWKYSIIQFIQTWKCCCCWTFSHTVVIIFCSSSIQHRTQIMSALGSCAVWGRKIPTTVPQPDLVPAFHDLKKVASVCRVYPEVWAFKKLSFAIVIWLRNIYIVLFGKSVIEHSPSYLKLAPSGFIGHS